jgi:hypothetical protein
MLVGLTGVGPAAMDTSLPEQLHGHRQTQTQMRSASAMLHTSTPGWVTCLPAALTLAHAERGTRPATPVYKNLWETVCMPYIGSRGSSCRSHSRRNLGAHSQQSSFHQVLSIVPGVRLAATSRGSSGTHPYGNTPAAAKVLPHGGGLYPKPTKHTGALAACGLVSNHYASPSPNTCSKQTTASQPF